MEAMVLTLGIYEVYYPWCILIASIGCRQDFKRSLDQCDLQFLAEHERPTSELIAAYVISRFPCKRSQLYLRSLYRHEGLLRSDLSNPRFGVPCSPRFLARDLGPEA